MWRELQNDPRESIFQSKPAPGTQSDGGQPQKPNSFCSKVRFTLHSGHLPRLCLLVLKALVTSASPTELRKTSASSLSHMVPVRLAATAGLDWVGQSSGSFPPHETGQSFPSSRRIADRSSVIGCLSTERSIHRPSQKGAGRRWSDIWPFDP